MTRAILAAVLAVFLAIPAAHAGTTEEVRALYARFAAAQNAHDLDAVGMLLRDSPDFLWVSDGMSIWGREATLARMSAFQTAELWRVEPDLGKSVAVEVSGTSAFLHLPLTLAVAFNGKPTERLRFLVSVLGIETQEGWRIAALFTTTEKTP